MARKAQEIVQLKVRMREPLRARLEKEAKAKGVSLNAATVDRLEGSFRDQDLASEVLRLAYGPKLAGILMAIGTVMNTAGVHAAFSGQGSVEAAQEWMNDPYAYDQAMRAAIEVLDKARPEGDPAPPESKDDVIAEQNATLGVRTAHVLLLAMGARALTGPFIEEAKQIRNLLGDVAKRMKLKESDK